MAPDTGVPPFVAKSLAMRETVQQIALMRDSAVPVLVFGEPGTGRETVARMIHKSGSRRLEPFVQVDCATLGDGMLDAVLFGDREPGRLEMAQAGTIFLRDIDRMPLPSQARLLAVLEKGVVERMQGRRVAPVRARLIASTEKELRDLAKAGQFRADLFNRLNLFRITLPPLRERRDDVPALMQLFLERNRARTAADGHVMEARAIAALQKYDWPGNIRELEQVVLSAILSSGADGVIRAEMLPPAIRALAGPAAAVSAIPAVPPPLVGLEADRIVPLEELERRAILHALKVTKGNVTRAARALGIGRATMYRKLERLKTPTP